ncbi:MAG: hypothetical protein HY331_16050 [Chloroflexi bacterium]|nr:hypothetical protein [Chloroflexota bacterium]
MPAKPGAQAVVIDPKQPKRVYAVNETGLYRSEDAGQTWQPAGSGLPDGGIRVLALDPRRPERLYAANSAGDLYVSEDGAGSWRALPGASIGADKT